MTKPVIVTRLGKGSELTFEEGDSNFTNLRDATINVSGDSGDTQNIDLNGTINVAGGTGISTAMSNGAVTVNLENTAVSPNTYTKATITVDQQGRVTSASSGSITSMDVTTALGYTPYNNTNPSGYISGVNSTDITTALGFTPENSGNKNAANGYAGLDASGKVASAQLPSYVDDVIEVADFASLPTTGETGKIYVALDTNVTYRWGGSAYVEITSSPGSTDEVTEGSTNLYFTDSRARNALSGVSGVEYNSSTGTFRLTSSGLPVVTTGTVTAIDGDTGDWIYVPSVASGFMMSYQIQFQGAGLMGTNIMMGMSYWIKDVDYANNRFTISDTMGGSVKDLNSATGLTDVTYQISMGGGGGTSTYKLQYNSSMNSVSWVGESTTPMSYSLSSLTDVSIMPPVTDGYVLTYDSIMGKWQAEALPASGIASVSVDTAPMLGGNLNVNGKSIVSLSNGDIVLAPNGTGIIRADKSLQVQAQGELRLADSDSSNYVGFKSPATVSTNKIWTLPAADGTSGQVLSTNGSGTLSWATAGGVSQPRAIIQGTISYQEFTGLQSTAIAETTLPHSWSETSDAANLVTVSGDNFTISSAGTYLIEYDNGYNCKWYASSINAGSGTRSLPTATFKLYNSTDATTIGIDYIGGHDNSMSTINGFSWGLRESHVTISSVVTIATAKTFNLRYAIEAAPSGVYGTLKLTYTYSPSLPMVRITKLA